MVDALPTVTTESPRRAGGIRLGTLMAAVAVAAFCCAFAVPNPAGVLERIDTALPWLSVATVALVACRLLPPHPPLERLARQPGFLACGVASVMLVGATAGSLTLCLVSTLVYGGPVWSAALTTFRSLSDWGYLVGFTVIVSWVVLGAVRGWKAEPNAFDRVGRAIGWAWVLLAPAGVALRLMELLGYLL